MRKNASRFIPFIENDNNSLQITLSDQADEDKIFYFCRQEVEPMGKEVEQLQIIALCSYLGIQVNILYLDGRSVI